MSPWSRPGAGPTRRTRPPPTGSDSMARRSMVRDRLRGGADPRSPPFATGSTASTGKNTHQGDSGSRELIVSSVVVQDERRELGPGRRTDPAHDQADGRRILLVGKRGVRRLGHVGAAIDPDPPIDVKAGETALMPPRLEPVRRSRRHSTAWI